LQNEIYEIILKMFRYSFLFLVFEGEEPSL